MAGLVKLPAAAVVVLVAVLGVAGKDEAVRCGFHGCV